MSDPSKSNDESSEQSDAGEFQQQVRDYSRAAGRMMWASFNREGLISAVKTLMWLVPITFLIWLYAERQQTDTTPSGIPIAIKVQINDPKNKKLAKLKMTESVVTARLNGPKSQIEDLQAEIRRRGINDPIILNIEPSTSVGAHSLNTDSLLSLNDLFVRSGVVAVNSKPENLEFFVDEYEDRTIEVQAPPDVSDNLQGQPVFTPASITVRAPHAAFPANGKIFVYADLASTGLLDKPGSQSANNIKIWASPMPADQVELSTSSVKATFDVRQLGATFTISSVPIYIQASASLQEKFWVKSNPLNLTNIEVIGPQEKLDLLMTKQLVKPVLDVDGDDRVGLPKKKLVRWEIDPSIAGVTVKSVAPQVEYQLVPIAQ